MSFLKMLMGGGSSQPQAGSASKVLDPEWRKGSRGGFNRLFDVDLDYFALEGQGGVYVLWHKGVQPAWIYVGHSDSLLSALDTAKDNEDFRQYDVRGGLYYTWSPILPEFRLGVVMYLRDHLEPLFEPLPSEPLPEEDEDGNVIEPIPVTLPR